MNRFRRHTLVLAAAAILVGVTSCGGGDDSQQAETTGAIDVTMKEFTVEPSPTTATAGQVTFNVANVGNQKHELVVVKTNRRADELLEGDEADETGAVDEIGDLPPGTTKTLAVELKAGHYALLCNLPGHYKAGQSADFDVK
jgi:uncharacterized cupredoxin-like copper-binding protein